MWTLTNKKDWNDLSQQFSWVADMHGVPQDAMHHAEGDVAIHTQMVLDVLTGMEAYQQLPAAQQEILWTAVLMHDIEKRSTTALEPDGHITSKGHAKRGAITVRHLLYTLYDAPFSVREHVSSLVRYHGLPLWAIEKPDPAKAVIQASLVTDTRLLALLATADAMGRICQDKDDLLYRIGLFKALCIEHDCWGKPRQFETANARFQFMNKEEAYAGYVPYDDFTSSVVLMSGLPGAGKDTFVARHYADWPVINLDDIRRKLRIAPTDKNGNGQVIQYAKEQARSYLRAKQNFVWNATNITATMRQQLVDLFTTYGAFVKIVYIEVPARMLSHQNKNRDYSVPANVMARLAHKLEVPMPWEAHEVVYYVEGKETGLPGV